MGLIQQMAEMLPAGAVIAGGTVDRGICFPFAEEEALARPMSTKRRQEFAAGRYYAREALRALGCEPAALPVQASRAPAWPQGVVGTISHSSGQCAAVLARRSNLRSIGIDIEAADPLPADLVSLVCRPADLTNRFAIERSISADLPKLVFVMKEAFYKTYQLVTGSFLDFVDVEVTIGPASRVFEGRVVNDSRPACAGRHTLGGRFGRVQNTLFAIAWLAPSGAGDCSQPRLVG
jgi:4'-phosphopantetheinyl transferase EntD